MFNDMDSADEENVFHFESDHVALRGNRDYANVLRTISVLQAQKVRVHQQLEELALAKTRYLKDPDLFLKKLLNNEEIIPPNYMTVAEVPEVGEYENMPPEEVQIKEEPESGLATELAVGRGRVADKSKPETFNQLWTREEQRRLEELLVEFPEEDVEFHRFAKIAKVLGNRTPHQVCSRVQKYFQKLLNAGLPIPGRKPKNRRIGQTKTKNVYRPTTFFSDVRATMLRSPSPAAMALPSNVIDSHHAEVQPPDARSRILYMLKEIRKEKASEDYNPDPMAAMCEVCEMMPVSSTRWRCNTCDCHLTLCGDCLTDQLISCKFKHIAHDVVIDNEM